VSVPPSDPTPLASLRQFVDGLRKVVRGLADADRLEEYVLAAGETCAIEALRQTAAQGVREAEALTLVVPLIQDLISAAEQYMLPLSSETEQLILRVRSAGFELRESHPRQPSRPLALAPKGPPEFSAFVDESGSASFDEQSQPVLSLVAVVVKDAIVPSFEKAAAELLASKGLPAETEFHTQEFLVRTPPPHLSHLDLDARYTLLRDFLALGLDHACGVHHLGMLKALVRPEFRRKMIEQGLNPYTHLFVWFLITLDRACLLVTMPGRCKYFYDRTDAYRKDIGRIFRALESSPNKRLQLLTLKGSPTALESHTSRFVQLADVAGYYLSRYRLFEFPKFPPRPELVKHEAKVREMYALIAPKIVTFIQKDLVITVDWQALGEFSLKRRQDPPWRPPVGRRRR
jgi:hypothetical protein